MKKIVLIFYILTYSSCLLSTRKDDAEDKAAAEAVVSKFVKYRKQKDDEKMLALFSDYFYRKNDSSTVKSTIKENYDSYGEITKVKLLKSSVHTSSHFFKTMGNAIFIYQFSSVKGSWKEAYGLSLKDGEYFISNFKILKRKSSPENTNH